MLREGRYDSGQNWHSGQGNNWDYRDHQNCDKCCRQSNWQYGQWKNWNTSYQWGQHQSDRWDSDYDQGWDDAAQDQTDRPHDREWAGRPKYAYRPKEQKCDSRKDPENRGYHKRYY